MIIIITVLVRFFSLLSVQTIVVGIKPKLLKQLLLNDL